MNSSIIDALHCRHKGKPPVWLMRQAGRYMPSYRALKSKYSFQELCFNPELIVQVTMMPIEQLGVDAAILFSDILIPLKALGVNVTYEDQQGPVLSPTIKQRDEIAQLHWDGFDSSFDGISKAIRELCSSLNVPLLGFCGAPFTLASYLIEGKTSKELRATKKWMMHDPEGFTELLNLLVKVSAAYLNLQIEAGVKAVQLFDSWAIALDPFHFQKYSVDMMQKVRELLPKDFPVIYFSRGSDRNANLLAQASPHAVSVDWTVDLPNIRKHHPHTAFQGNLDPACLYAPKESLAKSVNHLLQSMHNDPGYIFNLGHGLLPDTPYDNVKFLVDLVKN